MFAMRQPAVPSEWSHSAFQLRYLPLCATVLGSHAVFARTSLVLTDPGTERTDGCSHLQTSCNYRETGRGECQLHRA